GHARRIESDGLLRLDRDRAVVEFLERLDVLSDVVDQLHHRRWDEVVAGIPLDLSPRFLSVGQMEGRLLVAGRPGFREFLIDAGRGGSRSVSVSEKTQAERESDQKDLFHVDAESASIIRTESKDSPSALPLDFRQASLGLLPRTTGAGREGEVALEDRDRLGAPVQTQVAVDESLGDRIVGGRQAIRLLEVREGAGAVVLEPLRGETGIEISLAVVGVVANVLLRLLPVDGGIAALDPGAVQLDPAPLFLVDRIEERLRPSLLRERLRVV